MTRWQWLWLCLGLMLAGIGAVYFSGLGEAPTPAMAPPVALPQTPPAASGSAAVPAPLVLASDGAEASVPKGVDPFKAHLEKRGTALVVPRAGGVPQDVFKEALQRQQTESISTVSPFGR